VAGTTMKRPERRDDKQSNQTSTWSKAVQAPPLIYRSTASTELDLNNSAGKSVMGLATPLFRLHGKPSDFTEWFSGHKGPGRISAVVKKTGAMIYSRADP
jgi:hypothetical protein